MIRGLLELLGDALEERQATLALVTQELDRMSRIVTDLLSLAKAERPDLIQLRPGVDLATLTFDLDAKVQALRDRRWGLSHVAEGSCEIDLERLTQAVLQLAQNAVEHTRPGSRIVLCSRVDRGPAPGHAAASVTAPLSAQPTAPVTTPAPLPATFIQLDGESRASPRGVRPWAGDPGPREPASTFVVMRMGVIDVGSNTVHLLAVDAHWGAHPIPASSHKLDLRLSEHTEDTGEISKKGASTLIEFVRECQHCADEWGIEELMGFATSAIREAPNGDDVLARVKEETGVDLEVLPGEDESRLTFLAARRWFGWSAGRLFLVDIGGGSLELASGIDEDPDVALSLPLGAGRVTREQLPGDPPKKDVIRSVRKQIRADIAKHMRDLNKVGQPDRYVGTSKTIRSLARLCGAAPSAEGPYARRVLERDALRQLVPRLAGLSAAERAALPGVSVNRSRQVLAGALVIEAVMDLVGIQTLVVCPWALREGVILQRLDLLPVP